MTELVDLVKKRVAEIEALDPEQAAKQAQELWESLLDCADLITPLRGKLFRALKKATGWPYPKIAEATGASVTTVGSFFRGRQRKVDHPKSLPLRKRSAREKKARDAQLAARAAKVA